MTFNPEVLVDIVPDADLVLAMAPEDLGLILLRIAQSAQQNGSFHEAMANGAGRNGYGSLPDARRYPREKEDAVSAALGEAWAWLKNERLVLPASDAMNASNGWMVFGKRASELLVGKDLSTYRSASEFPKSLLHNAIAEKCWLSLARGDLEVAVLSAMKTVEVSVRGAANLSANDYGASLMKKAFNPNGGPLTDTDSLPSERLAVVELFTGAYGAFRNPSSHRDMPLTLPEAREMVMTASHLLRIIDRRRDRQ